MDHEINQKNLSKTQQKRRLNSAEIATKDSILFQCLCHNSFSQQELVEISSCNISYKVNNETREQYAEKEAIFQNNSILINKAILEKLKKDYPNIDENNMRDVYPLGIHLSGTYTIIQKPSYTNSYMI